MSFIGCKSIQEHYLKTKFRSRALINPRTSINKSISSMAIIDIPNGYGDRYFVCSSFILCGYSCPQTTISSLCKSQVYIDETTISGGSILIPNN